MRRKSTRRIVHKNKNTSSSKWTHALGFGDMLSMTQALLGPIKKRRGFAPIVWSNQRELLAMVRQFRAAMEVQADLTFAPQDIAPPVRAWYARSFELADAYIERLSRAIDERPQGKGGWQVASQLEKMYAEFAAHHDNPPPGMAVELESKGEPKQE